MKDNYTGINNSNILISRWLWLYLPPVLVFCQYLAADFLPYTSYRRTFETEYGFIENLTVVIALCAIITGFRIMAIADYFPAQKYRLFVLALIIGCAYILFEEISWGQHYFRWHTPEMLLELNQQKETNVHNIHNIFGVVPKIALEWTIYISGIFIVLINRLKNTRYLDKADWRYWLMPDFCIFPTALIAFTLRIADRLDNWFDAGFVVDWDETHELMLIYVIFLYMLTLLKRLQNEKLLQADAG